MATKSFKKDIIESTARTMIQASIEPAAETVKGSKKRKATEPTKPQENVIQEESKSARYNLLIKPSLKAKLEAFTAQYKNFNLSSNDVINRLIEQAMEEDSKELFERLYLKDYKA